LQFIPTNSEKHPVDVFKEKRGIFKGTSAPSWPLGGFTACADIVESLLGGRNSALEYWMFYAWFWWLFLDIFNLDLAIVGRAFFSF
jgi:hypothetical protein